MRQFLFYFKCVGEKNGMAFQLHTKRYEKKQNK